MIEINETGTRLRYRPGFLIGGVGLRHACTISRGIGYYLDALLCLAPFAKNPLEISLTGVTNDPRDISVCRNLRKEATHERSTRATENEELACCNSELFERLFVLGYLFFFAFAFLLCRWIPFVP